MKGRKQRWTLCPQPLKTWSEITCEPSWPRRASTPYTLIGIWFEERDLVVQFGERYRRYRAEVGMLLPRVPALGAAAASARVKRIGDCGEATARRRL